MNSGLRFELGYRISSLVEVLNDEIEKMEHENDPVCRAELKDQTDEIRDWIGELRAELKRVGGPLPRDIWD